MELSAGGLLLEQLFPATRPVGVDAGRKKSRLPARFCFQVPLEQQTDLIRPSFITADRLEAVRVNQRSHPRAARRNERQSSARASVPVARLLQTIQIIHARAGSIKSEPPVFLRSEWKRILSIEEDEPLGREFLVVIAGDVQRKFGDKRQHASQPVGAETICEFPLN